MTEHGKVVVPVALREVRAVVLLREPAPLVRFPRNACRIKSCRMTVLAWPGIDRHLSFQSQGIERRLAPHCNVWKRR